MSGWLTWVKLFHTFLAWHKSAIAGTPLSYIIRDKDEVTNKDRASEDCNLVDDNIVDTSVLLSGVACARDNKRVYDLLKPMVMEGPVYKNLIIGLTPFRSGRADCVPRSSGVAARSVLKLLPNVISRRVPGIALFSLEI